MRWTRTLMLSLGKEQRCSNSVLPTFFLRLCIPAWEEVYAVFESYCVLHFSGGWTFQHSSCTGQAGKVFLELCLLSEVGVFAQISVLYLHNWILKTGNGIKYWKDLLVKFQDWFDQCFAVIMWVCTEKKVIRSWKIFVGQKKNKKKKVKMNVQLHVWIFSPSFFFSLSYWVWRMHIPVELLCLLVIPFLKK